MANRWSAHIGFTLAAMVLALSSAASGAAVTSATTTMTSSPSTLSTSETEAIKITPIDWRNEIKASDFKMRTRGEWVSPKVVADFPFDELIYSWNAHLPAKQGFRLYLKVGFAPSDESPWLYAGYWGAVKDLATTRTKPVFDRGEMDMDWLKLKNRAASYQFRVVEASTAPLTILPSLTVITTDNKPSAGQAVHASLSTKQNSVSAPVLDVPLRRQVESSGTVTPNRCQSAALASALEYYGKKVNLEDIVALTYDPEYCYPGIWPRVIGAANQFGFDGSIERFRDWASVREALAANKMILCSIRLSKGECKSPPYEEMGNHIVVLNGVTDDGRVVVTDSFLGKSGRGYRCQWLLKDFEKIWMQTKNGVALVINPPKDAPVHAVKDLPPFPANREMAVGDDH